MVKEVNDFFQDGHILGFEIYVGKPGPGAPEIRRQVLHALGKIPVHPYPDSTLEPFKESSYFLLLDFPGRVCRKKPAPFRENPILNPFFADLRHERHSSQLLLLTQQLSGQF